MAEEQSLQNGEDSWDEEEAFVDLSEDSDYTDDEFSELDLEVLDTETNLDNNNDVAVVDVSESSDVSTSFLSYDEAQEITERIRAASDVLYILISRAHTGRAWEALNYDSFEAYVKTEFNISRSRAYQLINQSKVVEAIEAATPEGTPIRITEAAARELKSAIEDLAPQIREATAGRSIEDAGDIVEDLVRDFRAQREQSQNGNEEFSLGESYDEELLADLADREGFSDSGFGNMGGGSGYGNGSFPVDSSSIDSADEDLLLDDLDLGLDDDDDDDMDELLGLNENPSDVRKQFEAIYNLYVALASLSKMPDAKEIVPWIWAHEERRPQIDSNLPSAKEWIEDFARVWQEQQNAEGVSPSNDSEESDDDFDEDSEDFGSDGFDVDDEIENLFEDAQN